MGTYILAIDQGTTSSRAIVFDAQGQICGLGQQEFEQFFPANGWVEHDAVEIWESTLKVCRQALEAAGVQAADVAGCGITNQRETTVLWDRKTGEPVHRAIVWQDRRTSEYCAQLKQDGHEDDVQSRTGLLIDPYFSATKLRWLLDNVEGVRARAEAGELAFGTVDSWLLFKLTGGKKHLTDASNASRTLLFNIHEQAWDNELLKLFDIPAALLPDVLDNAADFGRIEADLLGAEIAVGGMVGDQQGALFGQACFEPGMTKSTYGTGCFLMLNLGEQPVRSRHRLLTTVGYRLGGRTSYALEGSIFVAGAAVQWLRDALHLIENAGETQALAESLPDNAGVYLVPAFTGLGAPYWDPDARGALFGLTRDTGIEQIVRAALEAVCYQTRDLLEAIGDDAIAPTQLKVDGGMVANDWLCQFLADSSQVPVARPPVIETTALGAAYLAGLQCGVYESLDDIRALFAGAQVFKPAATAEQADTWHAGWKDAVSKVRSG